MAKPKQDPAMLLFACAGIFLAVALDALDIVSTVGSNRYESAGLVGLYYGNRHNSALTPSGGGLSPHVCPLGKYPQLALLFLEMIADRLWIGRVTTAKPRDRGLVPAASLFNSCMVAKGYSPQ